jgi:rhomboid protease GluP
MNFGSIRIHDSRISCLSQYYSKSVFKRQRTGSVVCTSCGVLVGVNDDRCYNCGRRNPGLWGFAPALRTLGTDLGFFKFVIGTCVVIYVLMLLASGGNLNEGGILGFLGPSGGAMIAFGASGLLPVYGLGRWWTVLSAGWLHAGLLHIFFNMMAVRQLGPAVAELYGPARTVIIYVLASVCGFILSTLAAIYLPAFMPRGRYTLGASAAISGLIGAIYHYGRRGGSGVAREYARSSIVMLIVMGLMLPGIDNYAHAGGFGGGYLAALWLDPLKPERIDHVVIAIMCLALSLAAVVVSVLTALTFLG